MKRTILICCMLLIAAPVFAGAAGKSTGSKSKSKAQSAYSTNSQKKVLSSSLKSRSWGVIGWTLRVKFSGTIFRSWIFRGRERLIHAQSPSSRSTAPKAGCGMSARRTAWRRDSRRQGLG